MGIITALIHEWKKWSIAAVAEDQLENSLIGFMRTKRGYKTYFQLPTGRVIKFKTRTELAPGAPKKLLDQLVADLVGIYRGDATMTKNFSIAIDHFFHNAKPGDALLFNRDGTVTHDVE